VTPYTARRRSSKHAWVRLDAVCVRQPNAPRRVVPDGLDTSGAVPGRLTGWLTTVHGDWLGVVDYEVSYADG
jgi:hypothetical protein